MRNVVYQEADRKSRKINMLASVSSETNFNVSSVSQDPVSIEIFLDENGREKYKR